MIYAIIVGVIVITAFTIMLIIALKEKTIDKKQLDE